MSTSGRATRVALLAAILVSMVGCDQATKVYAVKNLKGQPQQSFFGDILRIQYVENPGAFLGLMGGLDPRVRFWTLTVANAAVMLWVGGYLLFNRRVDRWMFVALALILAGGIGNLIDRARLGGYVIDFIYLGLGDRVWQRTGIFNIADVAICIGVGLMAVDMFTSRRGPERREPPPLEPASANSPPMG